MTISDLTPDLKNLDADGVDEQMALLMAQIQEDQPAMDLRTGAFRDTIGLYSAVAAEANQELVDKTRRSMSLAAIEEDPTLAVGDVVDNVMSNYRVTRDAGGAAAGQITVVVSTNTTVTIASGATFSADGRKFATTGVFSAVADAANIGSDADRLMTRLSDGTYAFNVDVVAAENGTAGMLKKNTPAVPDSPPLNFVKAYAAADFTGGRDEETNAQLTQRLQEGLAAKALSGRVNMTAALKAESDFAGVLDSSVIGFGDAEMHRDQHAIWPGSVGGGRVDWYVRTQETLQLKTLTKTGTLIEKTSDGYGIWQLSITRDDFPGMYEARAVRPADQPDLEGTFTIESTTRSIDLTLPEGHEIVPDIESVTEGSFSRYEAILLQFTDTIQATDNLALGSTASYEVDVVGQPLIAEIQDWAISRNVRNAAADVLIRAPVPAFLQLSFTIQRKSGTPTPDTDAIKDDLMALVNRLGFIGRLSASQIAETVHNRLTAGQLIGAIDMFARVRQPDGTNSYLRSSSIITAPDKPELCLTERTMQFFLDKTDIAISVTQF